MKQRFAKIVYDLKPKEMEAIKGFLSDKLSTRQVAEVLKCSHQQVINMTANLARQWFREGKLKI